MVISLELCISHELRNVIDISSEVNGQGQQRYWNRIKSKDKLDFMIFPNHYKDIDNKGSKFKLGL